MYMIMFGKVDVYINKKTTLSSNMKKKVKDVAKNVFSRMIMRKSNDDLASLSHMTTDKLIGHQKKLQFINKRPDRHSKIDIDERIEMKLEEQENKSKMPAKLLSDASSFF